MCLDRTKTLPNKRLQLTARGFGLAGIAVRQLGLHFARASRLSQRAAGRCKVVHGRRQLSRKPLGRREKQ